MSHNTMPALPQLMEPTASVVLHQTLKQCHQFKQTYYRNLWSIVCFIVLIGGGGLVLYFRWKGKPTSAEIEQRNSKTKQFMLEQIKEYQLSKLRAQQVLITGLPHWKHEYDDVAWMQRILQNNS